ncbi:MAG: hypothetical protein ABIJ81_03010, partial [Patescibacteria group bacterium]
WRILWKHSWLWIFGLFAALAAGTGEYATLLASFNKLSRETGLVVALKHSIYTNELQQLTVGIAGFLNQPITLVVLILTLMATVVLLVVWVVTVSQIALVEAAGRIGQGEPADFNSSFKSGAKHFWPVLWLNILTRFLVYLLLMVATLPFLISYLARPGENWGFDWMFIISFIILIPLSLILVFVIKYAIAYVVLKGRPWWGALIEAINLFFRNWLVSLEMAGLLFIIYLALGMVIYIFLPAELPLIFAQLLYGFDFIVFLRLLPSLLIVLFIGAGYGAFQYLAWVLLFEKLTLGTALSKLVRLTTEVPEFIGGWFIAPTKQTRKIKR